MAPATRLSWPTPPTAKASRRPGTSATSSAAPPARSEAYRPSPLRNVLINEVLAHSENPALPCFIELYNHSNQTNDLSGCILTDDFATHKFVIPPGTLIPPRGFVSFDQSQLGFVPSAAGGTLFLVKPDGSRVLDAVQFEGQAEGVSFGRWPDGAAEFYPLSARTPGTNNSPIWIGDIVINELMYDPISGSDDDQYIELYNKGANTVDLANWQFTAGVSFTFPSGAVLAPGGYLVVAANLTNLLAKYSNLNTSNTVGNFGGRLSHKGERVALAMPQLATTATEQGAMTNLIYVVQDEVSYQTGGRWGQWAHGGGSSLELINPNSNHRLAYNWADSDETMKSAWTNLQYTGVLDNGANYVAPPSITSNWASWTLENAWWTTLQCSPAGPPAPTLSPTALSRRAWAGGRWKAITSARASNGHRLGGLSEFPVAPSALERQGVDPAGLRPGRPQPDHAGFRPDGDLGPGGPLAAR